MAQRPRILRLTSALGLVPFLGYLLIFLIIPTLTVAIGAFGEQGRPSLVNIADLANTAVLVSLGNSIVLSAATAVVGTGSIGRAVAGRLARRVRQRHRE